LGIRFLRQDALPSDPLAHEFVGEKYGGAGEMAVVDAGQPHSFVNSGEGRLRQVEIHLSPRFITEWLA